MNFQNELRRRERRSRSIGYRLFNIGNQFCRNGRDWRKTMMFQDGIKSTDVRTKFDRDGTRFLARKLQHQAAIGQKIRPALILTVLDFFSWHKSMLPSPQ